MTKREFIAEFVLAHVRTGQSALNSTNMDIIVRIADRRWKEIVAVTPVEVELTDA